MIDKAYYDAAELQEVLRWLEELHGMSSAQFYEAHLADRVPEGMTGFHRHAWASFYRELTLLRERDGFAAAAQHVLAGAS